MFYIERLILLRDNGGEEERRSYSLIVINCCANLIRCQLLGFICQLTQGRSFGRGNLNRENAPIGLVCKQAYRGAFSCLMIHVEELAIVG